MAVKDISSGYEELGEKVDILIRRLSYQISSIKFRVPAYLRRRILTDRWWGSMFRMLNQHMRPCSVISKVCLYEIKELLLNDNEDENVTKLLRLLRDPDLVSMEV